MNHAGLYSMIGTRFSHYRIVERIGAGGMGEVYRAQDEHLPRNVAIKILPAGTLADEATRKRFRKEAETLSQLNHPHIATVYDFDTQDGVDFLVMEYVDGTTLAERLEHGALPTDEVLRIGSEIAWALEEAHGRGIVHRDLKPRNIGLTQKNQVKVLDFGLARVLRPSTDTVTTKSMTETPGFAGTLPYMAPEQLRGAASDHRSDLYSLGVVLYEMATGRRPFEQELASALIADIVNAVPVPPRHLNPSLPRALELVILKCLAKDPARRYRSAHDLPHALHRAALPSSRVALVAHFLASRRSIAIAAAALVLGIGLFALNVGGLRDKLSSRVGLQIIESVVALPSEVLGTDEEERFLTDAIPRTLSTYLGQVEGLETKMPPTSIEMERIGGDLEKLTRAYGVGAFVVSTVTTRSELLVINVQLVQARTRRLMWSREYRGQRQDFLDVVHAAAEGLREAIRPAAAPVPAVMTKSEPEIVFQRALYYSNRYNNLRLPADFDRALAEFQQVLQLDPKRADAAAELSMLHIFQYESGIQEALPQLASWARRALQIDPRNGRAWAGLAWYEFLTGNARASLHAGLRAVSLAPKDAFCFNSQGPFLFATSARLELEAYLLSWQLDPLYPYPPLNAARTMGLLGRPTEGLALLDQVLELEPDMPWVLWERIPLLVSLGRSKEASLLLRRLETMADDRRLPPSDLEASRALLTVLIGDAEERRAAMTRVLASEGLAWIVARRIIAMILADRGEIDPAHEMLARSGSPGTPPPYDWLMLCPSFRALREDPRFLRIASEARSEFEILLTDLEESRNRSEFPAYLEEPLAKLVTELGMSAHK